MSFSAASTASEKKLAAMRAEGKRLTLKTGLCLAGFCEGKKPRNRDGVALPTCRMFMDCPCKCHTDLDEIFEMSGKPRELVENPDYVPVHIDLSDLIEVVAMPGVTSDDELDSNALSTPAPGLVPAHRNPTFPPTPSGRLARGQAGYLTLAATDTWAVENTLTERIEPCTPLYVVAHVAKYFELRIDPSTVTAVYRRWAMMGFAEIADSPVRFLSYSEEAIKMGYEVYEKNYERKVAMGAAR